MRPATAPAALAFSRLQDPIVAIATAPGRAAVGIVRASGRGLRPLIEALCGRALLPRQATLLPFLDADGSAIDRGLAIHFPAPHSYTGEEVLELQAHGGPVVLQLLLARCLQALPRARLAGPGEFTLRAFLNVKIDLVQAEAVADLIDASTEAAARSASRAVEGQFSARVTALAAEIVQLRTLVEATLDFPEEEIDFLDRYQAHTRLDRIAQRLDEVLAGARQGVLLREGLRVVIAGQPNVGKSSLLNALAGAELAIVTAIPGTTRDRVSETIQIEGVPVHVTDTAGLRGDDEAQDEVERIGIGRSWQAIASADAVLFLHDPTRRGDPAYEAGERSIAAQLPAGGAVLHVHTKSDLIGARAGQPRDEPAGPAPACEPVMAPAAIAAAAGGEAAVSLAVSSRSGAGLAALRDELLRRAGWQAVQEGLFSARTRHVQALQNAGEHLREARAQAAAGNPALELLAEELRLAHVALGEITGAFTPDDLLGQIFGSFCIGK